eukprot:Tamp_07998.p1 GENE.Tamp_07998~~Tamp_07998.p1  ORF type:complete len:512 (-),score=114.06 Tamp_07998:861-2288(-)
MRIIIVRACLSVQRQGAAGVPASAGQHACPPPSCCRAGASRQASHLRSGWRTLPATPPLPLSRARAAKAEYGSPCEKQRSNPPRWRLSAVQRQVPDEHLSLDTVDLQQVEDEMFSSDDSASASDAGEQPWLQEQAQVMQALRLVKGEDMSAARDMAEATLNANPANAPALFVNAAECETRQDWSEAARFFLVGLSHNSSDPNMEQGFQTNVDMLRAQRRRLVERSLPNKWEDVLSFKPKTMVVRPPSPEDKPPWHRLGPVFEEFVAEPVCHIKDLLESQQDADGEVMELRRIIYQNLPYLNRLYAYYQQDLNDSQNSDEPLKDQVEHDGHDPCDDEEPMQLYCLWRIFKECKIAMGNVKVKMPVAVFDRIHVQGKRRLARMQQDASFDVAAQDPHARTLPVHFYDWIETLIRVAVLKLQGTLSQRFEALIKDFLRPFAMRKQIDKGFLEFQQPEIRQVFLDPYIAEKSRKVCHSI